MSSQVLTSQTSVSVFSRLLRAHSSLSRELSARLVTDHGLTINDYEALLHLSHAEEGSLRRVDLAERLMLTPSGVTRLLDGLERDGWVRKGNCDSDARVTYAVLTDEGRERRSFFSATGREKKEEEGGDPYSLFHKMYRDRSSFLTMSSSIFVT